MCKAFPFQLVFPRISILGQLNLQSSRFVPPSPNVSK